MGAKTALQGNRPFLFRMLASSLVRRRSRLLVALTGIAIGATVLLGLVTLCYDIPRQLSREFRSYGANLAFVPVGGALALDRGLLEKARAFLPQGELVGLTPFRYESVRSRMLPYTAVGTDFTEARKTSPFYRVEGAWPARPGEILVGGDVAERTGLGPGKTMPLDGRNSRRERYDQEFAVVGVVITGGVEDEFVFLSLSDMEAMTGEEGRVDLAEASLSAGKDELERIAGAIKAALPGVDARLVTQVTRSEETVLAKLTSLVYLVTAVVLTLTMICVATTMMTVVLERRREIGLKKALGADNRRVAREFLAEGLCLGIAGGLLGSALGLIFARVVSENVFGRALNPELFLIPLTVLVSALVTVVACLAPVRRAVDVEPALVLRGE
ncbi:MAG: ABC transporter permease [Deltaproteobacteria bacterium]|jgi:putative ABC transport system permease protein|nr:ABC transporter permease [Deltaproteobacteria bacterium]